MRTVAIIATALFTSACAFTDVRLTLPTESAEGALPDARGRQVIVVVPFSDERAIRDRCGMQKNGYNMDTADAVCQSDPNAWIAGLLANELRRAGFQVLGEGDSHKKSALKLEGSLLKIFVEPVIGFWSGSLEADLSVRLHATSDTGLDAERTFFVKGWKGGVQLSTSGPYQDALSRATKQMLTELVAAVMELVEKYPQLGRNGDGSFTVAVSMQGVDR